MEEIKKGEEKGVEVKNLKNDLKTENPDASAPMRQIIIETNGNDIRLVKAEVGGKIELVGILQGLITFLNQPK